PLPSALPHLVGHAVRPNGVEPGIHDGIFKIAPSGGAVQAGVLQSLPDRGKNAEARSSVFTLTFSCRLLTAWASQRAYSLAGAKHTHHMQHATAVGYSRNFYSGWPTAVACRG